jgi:hypothetical protein
VQAAQEQSDTRIGFWATDLVLVGTPLAARGLRRPLDGLLRDGDLSLTAEVAVVQGEASSLLETPQPGGSALEIGQRLQHSQGTNTGSIPTPFWRFIARLATPYDAAWAPVLRQSAQGYVAAGTAVFRGDRLAAVIPQTQTPALGWLVQRGGFAPLTFAGPAGQRLALDVVGRRLQLLVPGPRSATLRLSLFAFLRQGAGLSLVGRGPRRQLEHLAAAQARAEVEAVVAALQAEGADVVGFGEVLRQHDPAAVANWPVTFARMHIACVVQVRIREGGRRLH